MEIIYLPDMNKDEQNREGPIGNVVISAHDRWQELNPMTNSDSNRERVSVIHNILGFGLCHNHENQLPKQC